MSSTTDSMDGEDLYSDGMGSDAAAKDTKPKDDGDDSQEAILPRSICPDMEVGDELVLKITAIHDKTISVKYAPEEGKEKESSDAKEKADMPAEMATGGNDMYD